MTWWEALLLGLVQGLTEFIPVSSSGHLVLGQYLLGLDAEQADITFEVFVHFGTVLSILTVYGKEVMALVTEAWTALRHPTAVPTRYRENDTFRLGVFILITLIPTGVVYLLFKCSELSNTGCTLENVDGAYAAKIERPACGHAPRRGDRARPVRASGTQLLSRRPSSSSPCGSLLPHSLSPTSSPGSLSL